MDWTTIRGAGILLRVPDMSSAAQICGLAGCLKLTAGKKHITCSKLHHFLLMVDRFSRLHAHLPAPLSLSPNSCALSPCQHPPYPGFICCSRSHYLEWFRRLFEYLRSDQICGLPGCHRHVFVSVRGDGSLRAHRFCGWTHCQEFHIRGCQASVGEGSSCLQHSVESLIESLKAYARNKNIAPRNVLVDEAFFTKHPWDVLDGPEVESCWLIARCLFNEKDKSKRELMTRDGYHWKQQGPTCSHSSELSRKHFTYKLLRNRKRGKGDLEDTVCTLTEYTLRSHAIAEENNYCLVQVCCKKKKSGKRVRRELEAYSETSVRTIIHDEAQNSHTQPNTTDPMGLTGAPGADQAIFQRGGTMSLQLMSITEETEDTEEEIQYDCFFNDRNLVPPLSVLIPAVGISTEPQFLCHDSAWQNC